MLSPHPDFSVREQSVFSVVWHPSRNVLQGIEISRSLLRPFSLLLARRGGVSACLAAVIASLAAKDACGESVWGFCSTCYIRCDCFLLVVSVVFLVLCCCLLLADSGRSVVPLPFTVSLFLLKLPELPDCPCIQTLYTTSKLARSLETTYHGL